MNKAKLVLASAIMVAVSTAQAYTLETDAERVGYTIGADMGTTLGEFAGSEDSLSFHALIVGLRDAYEGNELSMSAEEMDATMQTFAQKRMQALQQEQTKMQEENLQSGREFLEANAKKEGVQTTDSGLQYLVLEEGEGETPSADANVTVHYEGRLIDGTVFDSSAKAGQPVTFNVNEVIDGWVEGLQLMKEGGKYRLFIPSELAYGEMGAGPSVPPNSTLIFDVELLEINSDTAATQAEQDTNEATNDVEQSEADDVAAATIDEAKANAEEAEQDAKEIAEEVSNEAEQMGEEMDAAVEDAQAQAQEGIEAVERETATVTDAVEQEVDQATEAASEDSEQAQTGIEEVERETATVTDAVEQEADQATEAASEDSEQAQTGIEAEESPEVAQEAETVSEPEAEVIINAQPADVGENAEEVAIEVQDNAEENANNSLQEMGDNAATDQAETSEEEAVEAEADEKNVIESALDAAGEGIEDATNAIGETVSDAADAIMGDDKQ